MGLNWVPEAEELPCHIGARTARLVRTQRREDFDDLLVNAFYFFGGRGRGGAGRGGAGWEGGLWRWMG